MIRRRIIIITTTIIIIIIIIITNINFYTALASSRSGSGASPWLSMIQSSVLAALPEATITESNSLSGMTITGMSAVSGG